jgi:3-oxoadipate enol-lactonase
VNLSLRGGELLHYRVDDFCDPWTRPTAILAIHGLAESGRVWFAWVPALARTHPLIRPDLPGFGLSTPVAENGHWSVDDVADTLASLIDHLGHAAVHVIGQRAGGAIALNLALRHPARIRSLVLISAPLALPQSRGNASGTSWREQLRQHGVDGLNRRTMKGRLGNAPQAQQDWWIDEMSRAALPSMMAAAEAMESLDLAARLEQVQAPTLLITSDKGTLVPLSDVLAAHLKMAQSRLMVLPVDSYHLAATEPDVCSAAALKFIDQVDGRCDHSNPP